MHESKKITKKDLHQEIKERGWRQGSWLFVNDKNSLGLNFGFYIVITQDCNLVNHSFEKESSVELVLATEIAKIDSRCLDGKNPRKLQFYCDIKKEYKKFECQINNTYCIDRGHLATESPYYQLDEETKDLLIGCVIKKYNRAAFPHNFNKRINKKKIQDILQSHLSDIYKLYIQLSTFEELSDEENYKINLYILVKDETNDQKLNEIAVSLDEIVTILGKCKICAEDDCRAVRLSDISYGKVLSLYEWDFEYLSYQ
ncbi:MAG: hypothetical protein PVG30_04280 [Gammaproteobacteria bacterium]|jgi:hypothetical protein